MNTQNNPQWTSAQYMTPPEGKTYFNPFKHESLIRDAIESADCFGMGRLTTAAKTLEMNDIIFNILDVESAIWNMATPYKKLQAFKY